MLLVCGQSSQYVKSFTKDLTQAAADYAAYMGMTDSQQINDLGKKMAKATLGEVGQLKDIGINIDVNAGSFKQLISDIKEATGVSDAMAKQMAIAKEIINEVNFAQGTASKNMFDGWSQLNITLDEFKSILGDVGKIFSTVFGPALKVFNSILQIPFVKSTTAWVVAIGSVYLGFISLLGVLKRIKTLMENTSSTRKLNNKEIEQSNKLQKQFVLLKQREYHLQQKIQDLYANRQSLKQQAKQVGQGVSKRGTQIGREYDNDANKLSAANKDLAKTQQDIKAVANELSGLGQDALQALASMTGLDEEFQLFVNALALSKITTKGNTIAIIAETAAKIKNTIATWASASANKSVSIGGAFTSVLVALGASLKWVAGFFVKTLPALLKPVLTVLTSTVLPILLAVGKILLYVAAAIIIPFDAVTMLINIFSGKDLYTGTISKWIAEFIFQAETNQKQLQARFKRSKQANNQYKSFVNSLNKQLEAIRLDASLDKLIPQDAIKKLRVRSTDISKQIKIIQNDIAKFQLDLIQAYLIDDKTQRDNAIKAAKDKGQQLKSKRTELQKSLIEVNNQIDGQKNRLKSIVDNYVNALKDINKKLQGVKVDFSFGYKDGKFGKQNQSVQNMLNQQTEAALRKQLANYRGWYDPTQYGNDSTGSLQKQQSLLKQLFDVAKENFKYQLQSMYKQREAAIENLRSMNEFIKQAYKFKETAQAGIEAGSMQSIRLQTRQLQQPDKQSYQPIIEQQKQIKQIEKQMLVQQKSGKMSLERIATHLQAVLNKLNPGAAAEVVVNPF